MKVVTGNQGKNKRKAVGHPGDVPIVYIASPTGQMSIYVSVGVAVPPVPPVPPVPHNGTGLGGGQRGACNVPSPRRQRTGKRDKNVDMPP